MVLPAIIGAGALLGGSYLSNRSAKKQQQQQNQFSEEQFNRQIKHNWEIAQHNRDWALDDQRNAIPRLVNSAKAAKISPLTALGSSVAGGFGSTGTTLAAAQAPLASAAAISGTSADVGLAFANAAGQVAQAVYAKKDLERITKETMDAGGARKTLERTMGKLATLPKVAGVASLGRSAQPAWAGDIGSHVQGQQAEQGELLYTNPNAAHSDKFVDPRRRDSEHGEQRYGDLGQEEMGIKNRFHDYMFDKLMRPFAAKYGHDAAQEVVSILAVNPKRDPRSIMEEVARRRPVKRRPKLRPPTAAQRKSHMKQNYPTVYDN